MMSDEHNIKQLVDKLFRHESGRMVASLTRIFGAENLQLAEDVVQETLIKALQQWAYKGIPDNPSAWLMHVAKNHALDILRRQSNYEQKISLLEPKSPSKSLEDNINFDNQIEDDVVAMLFMGCHPTLSQEMQVTLLLKTLGGFSVPEIAHAFLVPEATIAQRIVRARRKLRDESVQFVMPDDSTLGERLETVLAVIYLIFSEGYKASEGNHLIRKDLCHEAIRLCDILLTHPQGNLAQIHALMALMLFQSSRLEARVENGRLLLLAQQDRTTWNQQQIQVALAHLEKSAQSDTLTSYHLQAGIAACHALAPSYDDTDWEQILAYYDHLLQVDHSPFIQLNRLVALSMTGELAPALKQLEALEGLQAYYLYHATLADFDYRLKNYPQALNHYEDALKLTNNAIEQAFIKGKIAEIKRAYL